jgi:hypothetical protein
MSTPPEPGPWFTEPQPQPESGQGGPLARDRAALALWDTVVRSRENLARERRQSSSGSLSQARLDLLLALEDYVSSLGSRGRPVPYALRDELRILRLAHPHDAAGSHYSPRSGGNR